MYPCDAPSALDGPPAHLGSFGGLLRRLCLVLKHFASIQCGCVARQVPVYCIEDWQQVWMQAIHFLLSLPLPLDEATIREATEIVRDSALFKPEFLDDLADIVRSLPKQLHYREACSVR